MPESPTRRTAESLTQAYDFFNAALFDGKLPPCLITLQRRQGAYGFFSGGRFASTGNPDEIRDEIALNPSHFGSRRPREILSTLVHEMTHLWQHHFGKPSRAGYHNRQWAKKMHSLGLIPIGNSPTEEKATGQRVSYGMEEGGACERACGAFLASGPTLLYQDRPTEAGNKPPTSRGKTKYTCPRCQVKVWAKPALLLLCVACQQTLQVASAERGQGAESGVL
ncbi:MAG: hypothetical protein JWN14_1364 [Chthonomonadales bacterium]|nr:hypothetical protein [Chthonomonadales bacterium]